MFDLTILGAGPSCPNPGGASSGYLLRGPDGPVLLDCGHGIAGAVQTQVSLNELQAIVISHMHPDHYFDLLPFRYGLQFYGVERMRLYLPPNGAAVLDGLEPVLGLPTGFFADRYAIEEYDTRRSLTLSGLEMTFSPTQHFIPAYALRIAGGGSTLFYSADTGPNEGVTEFASGADLGLVEATLEKPRDGAGTPGHMSGTQAGNLARSAGVKRLLLTHYWEPYAETVLKEAKSVFGPAVALAERGTTYTV